MIEKITTDLYMITLPMPFRLEHIHVFALIHNGKVALFDTGMNTPDTFSELEKSLNVIEKSIHDIDMIFITHYHADHCGIAGRIKEISGAVIYMSETGKEILQNHRKEELLIEKIKKFYIEQGITEQAVTILTQLFRQFKKATIPFEVDECLDFDRKYHIGNAEFEVLPTPGHARDHVCYFFRKRKLLLSGDHVLPDITPNLGPDLFRPTYRALQSFLESLTMVETLPVKHVFPAHGEPYPDLKARVREIKEHHDERKSLILAAAQVCPKTAFQLSLDIFGTDLDEFDTFLALNETYVHVVELMHEDLIKEERGNKTILYRTTT